MMISGQLNPTIDNGDQPQPPPEVRLRMKPDGAALGYVDGGWWPWSADLAAELPPLVSALGAWLGPVARVSYHLDTWGLVARKVSIGGRVVRVEGFRSTDPHTIMVIGSDSRRVSLLVVPPDLPGGVARAVLRSAAGGDSIASVADILASNGVLPGAGSADSELEVTVPVVVPGPRVTEATAGEAVAEERWEAEGGRARPA